MKPIAWIRLSLLCVAVGQFRGGEARNVRSASQKQDVLQEKVDSLINPPLMEQGEQILRFEETVLNIGTLSEDEAPKTFYFACTNVSGRTINLIRVRTTCGCTAADTFIGEMLAGEKRNIALTYNPRNHPGTIDTDAFIYLSLSDIIPVARLTLIGNVLPAADGWARYPYAMGKLRLKQKRMEFKNLNPGEHPSERILCGNSGKEPLRLLVSDMPEFMSFRTEPEMIDPGNEADIIVTIDVSLFSAEKRDSFVFPIVMEGVGGTLSERTLNIKINRIE